jgi:hypothetical protein
MGLHKDELETHYVYLKLMSRLRPLKVHTNTLLLLFYAAQSMHHAIAQSFQA